MSDINAKMQKRVPELKSKYAAYPMNEVSWLKPPAKAPNGKPLFIKSPQPEKGEVKEVKLDYVWGPGTYGFGYYHMLMKEAYVILSARLQKESAPSIGCGCFGGGEKDPDKLSDLKEIHHIMYFRSM